jgi:hypothetical protein
MDIDTKAVELLIAAMLEEELGRKPTKEEIKAELQKMLDD